MFSELKKKLADNFNRMASDNQTLFYVNIDRDAIWEKYLAGFSDEERQENTCNCCKSFLRQYAGIVAIKNNKRVSIWDGIEVQGFETPVDNLRKYIHSLPTSDVFMNEHASCGTDKNFDSKKGLNWTHFHIKLPTKFVGRNLDTLRAEKRDTKNVFKRSLDELKIDATETILELIGQNSLYRGKEFEGMLKEFLKVQKQYAALKDDEKDNFCWTTATSQSAALSRIRNSAIGTLLINLSEGMELDTAVGKFEQVVAPSNYKRPTALVTPKMVEQAKAKICELGLEDSLNRRFANEADVSVENLLFVDRSSVLNNDVFAEIGKEAVVNPRTLTKVEDISIDDFINKVVPTSSSIEALVENRHTSNMVSLITAQNSAKSPFKWNNNFSWSYTGGVTDSIKELVKAAGGNVNGILRVSLSWFNYDDLDLHVHEPSGGAHIYYGNKRSVTTGHLDVDMNAGGGTTRTPVENIVWTNKSLMKEGTYKVKVNNFSKRETSNVGFVVQVECNGEVFDYEFSTSPKNSTTQDILEFEFSKKDGIKIKGDAKSSIVSKEKWGVKTNQFVKVKNIMFSPNHWNGAIGNKHYIFSLENCVSDEAPRPFYNEFLKEELNENRKVFEILASKIKVESEKNQLSGLGFSETQKNHLIVRVQGKFKRTLKVNF